MSRLLRNAARCLNCNTLLESRHLGDYRNCSCGQLEIGGGLVEPWRRARTPDWADLSIYDDEEEVPRVRSGRETGDRDGASGAGVRDGGGGASGSPAQSGRAGGRKSSGSSGGVRSG